MNTKELINELERFKDSDYFTLDADGVLQQARAAMLDPEQSIPALLRFMEDNPRVDFGSPGSIVKYLEEFMSMGYERELLASVSRQPTTHTVWMLNRILNVDIERTARDQAIALLDRIARDQNADIQIRELAEQFLKKWRS